MVFNDLAERFKKRGVVAIFSDFFDEPARILTGLKHFRHRRHEVIVFHILDPAELDFPFRIDDALQGTGRHARHPDRAPRLAASLSGRAARRS